MKNIATKTAQHDLITVLKTRIAVGAQRVYVPPRQIDILAGQDRCAPTAGHGTPQPALGSCPPTPTKPHNQENFMLMKQQAMGGKVYSQPQHALPTGLPPGPPAPAEPHDFPPPAAAQCVFGQPDELHPGAGWHDQPSLLAVP